MKHDIQIVCENMAINYIKSIGKKWENTPKLKMIKFV